MKLIKLPYLIVFSISIFFSCKPKEKDEPKAVALDMKVDYVGIKTTNRDNRYFGSILDSSSNTYYIVFDTTKFHYYTEKTALELEIGTKGQLSISKTSAFNVSEPTYFEVGDGLGNKTNYSIIPVLTSAKSDFEYTFDTYSENGVNIESNKKIRILGVNENTYSWPSFLFQTGFSPIFEDQYANTKDNLYLNFCTNDITPLIIDGDSINLVDKDLHWSYIGIKNVPRDTESRMLFFQQKNFQDLSCMFALRFLKFPSDWQHRIVAYANFISYNPFLESIDLDVYFKVPFNYTSETTSGGTIDGKIELRNFSIKNTSY